MNNINITNVNNSNNTLNKTTKIKNSTINKVNNITRNTQKLSAEKVKRKNEILCVGDLHGNYDIYKANLLSLGVINEGGNWIAGDKTVIFHGDILADRYCNGIDILEDISHLKNQAKEVNGNIIVLAGNHDAWAISFLGGIHTQEGTHPVDISSNRNQGKGLIEFVNNFTGIEIEKVYEIDEENIEGIDILENMRNSTLGKKILLQIINFRLVEHIDDTIFLHTDPTQNIINMILKKGVDEINNIFKCGLIDIIINSREPSNEYFKVVKTFLHTQNRLSFYKNLSEPLQDIGINHVIHGHSDLKGKIEINGGIKIVSVDKSAGKKGKVCDLRSILKINKDGGKIDIFKDK